MTVDHLTWTLMPGYSRVWWVVVLHVIGRLTAPIMWFFIAEGYQNQSVIAFKKETER